MNDNETPSSQPASGETSNGQLESGSPGWTRRNFLYGSAAAAAVMFGGIARPAVRPAGHGIPGLRRAHVVADQSSPWTLAYKGPQVSGPDSITLTLGTDAQGQNYASTPGSLVVAALLSTAGGTPFTPPSGWQSAGAVEVLATSSPGRLEIWYYLGTPGSQTAITTATFTSSGGACRGCMSNFTLPPNTEFVLLDAVGQGTSRPAHLPQTTFGPTVASWNVANDLGIVVAGDFFSGSPTGSWTPPSGYTYLRVQNGISANFGAWYDLGLSGTGVQAPSLQYQYSGTSGQLGWGALFAAFRAVAFQPVYLTGGEMATMAALDPSGQQLIMAGDVEGMFRSSDFGNTWQLSQSQLYGQNWNNACVAWSLLESGTVVYSCVGKESASEPNTDGGLLVSTDGGITWSLRSKQVQFNGNDVPSQSDSPSGPRPSDESGDDDRSIGHLLAQDTVDQYLYAATFNAGAGTTYVGGVARSNASYATPSPAGPVGTNWQSCGFVGSPPGLPASNFYPRALALNTSTVQGANKELWVGTWDSTLDGTYGGVWYCSNAQTASQFSDWVQMPGFPTSTGSTYAGSVSDLKVLDGYLYATCNTMGIFRWEIGGSSNKWTSLNATPINVSASQGQVWTSLDGYVDQDRNHQIFAGCSSGESPGDVNGRGTAYQNIVQITITSAGGITAADLTSNPKTSTINLDMPNGQQFWLAGASFANFLGGKKFCNPHILVNPDNQEMIFVTGASGLCYTLTGGVNPATPNPVAWQLAGTGVPLSAIAAIAVDPQNDQHIIFASADHIQTDLTDPTAWNVAGGGVNAISMPTLFPSATYPAYNGNESHAVAFDPNSNVYTGMNEKFGKNAGGTVWWRPVNSLVTNIKEMGYNAAVASVMKVASDLVNAPIGIFAGVDGAETYVVAVSDGAGVYRTWANTSSVIAGSPSWASWTRVSVNGVGTNGGNPGLHCPIVADPYNAGVLYAYDRNMGIYASNSSGKSGSWSLLWALPSGVNVTDGRSGWLAANPRSSAGNFELWLTTSSGSAGDAVYKLTGTYSAATGFTVSATAMAGSNFPYGAAGIAITSAGKVYTPAISGASSPIVQLFAYPSGGPWTQADDGSIGTYVSWPTCLALSANPYSLPTAGAEILLVASDSDWAVYGTPTA